MVFEKIIRCSPRRRASHSIAEGFSPTASPIYRINFSKTIKQFLYDTARKAAEASKEGGFLGFGGTAVSDIERQALADLASALGLTV